MPELPEVEAARVMAEGVLRRRRIAEVAARPDPVVFEGASARRVAVALRGRRVQALRRKGKHLWIELDRRPWPLLHFGMTGWLFSYREVASRPRHWKLELTMEGGVRVCFSDPRRFGRVRLQMDPLNEPPVSELGFDVLEGLPPAALLAELLSRRRAPIKAVLLDQSLFAGVGNWIADEALYQARLAPHRRADSLAPADVARLRTRLHAVVRRAVAVGADSERFPRGWLFHRRWDARPPADAREKIVRETIGGRTAAWVPARQR
ncbi:MAG TPA: DNA-formamidopyrimidine glycosylase family protein [Vicinamibacteria bacterium]|nr:DNA-formamidopyrimidine glycosylase family protein [Vicinamibacteria bacterium]